MQISVFSREKEAGQMGRRIDPNTGQALKSPVRGCRRLGVGDTLGQPPSMHQNGLDKVLMYPLKDYAKMISILYFHLNFYTCRRAKKCSMNIYR